MNTERDFTTALIVSTYNNPRYLALCLESVMRQSLMPDVVIVADDGSTSDTAALLAEFQSRFPVRLLHEWQPDYGFRKTVILNKAVGRTDADYLILIDGDIILHPEFIKDHIRFARRGSFVTGSRVRLPGQETARLVEGGFPDRDRLLGLCHRHMNGLRIPMLTPLFRNYRSADGKYARGCNMAVWRDDFVRVNGFNNEITGWGREDSELSWRLINAGVKKSFIKFSAIELHLHHAEFSRVLDGRNLEIMNRAREMRVKHAASGFAEASVGPVGDAPLK